MKHSTSSYRAEISRRTMLATAAAMAASPAFADECHIGPPTHEKGPRVWMDLDQVELDAAYDQAFYAPLRLEILKRLASNSAMVRARLIASCTERWCFAHTPEIRRGTILPRSVTK